MERRTADRLTVEADRLRVHLAIPAKKRQQLAHNLASTGEKIINRRCLRKLTGLVEWLAGLLPQLQPLAQQLWAAISSRGVDRFHVWRRQIDLALRWLQALVDDESNKLQRTLSAVPPATVICIEFDASTTEGGAILWFLSTTGQALPLAGLPTQTPNAYLATRWTEQDCKAAQAAQAKKADSGSQARWEAYALLVAVATWQPVTLASKSPLMAIGDALGMLQGATRFRSTRTLS